MRKQIPIQTASVVDFIKHVTLKPGEKITIIIGTEEYEVVADRPLALVVTVSGHEGRA